MFMQILLCAVSLGIRNVYADFVINRGTVVPSLPTPSFTNPQQVLSNAQARAHLFNIVQASSWSASISSLDESIQSAHTSAWASLESEVTAKSAGERMEGFFKTAGYTIADIVFANGMATTLPLSQIGIPRCPRISGK